MTTTAPQGRLLRRGLRVIGRQVALHPRPFVIAVAGAAVYALGTVAQSWVLGQVVDRAVTPRFETGQLRAGVAVAAACAIVAVGLVKTVGIITRRIAATIVHADVQATLRERLAERYHRLPLTWHHRHPAGELLSRAEGDLDAASEILSPLPFATGVLTMLGAAAVWLFLADLFLAALGVLVVPAILVINLAFQRRVEHPTTLGQERLGDVSAVAHESFDGALVVKALQAEEAEGRRFADKAELLRDARIEAARVTANFEASLDALPAVTTVALLVVGVWRIEQGAITAGTLVGLINLFALLIWPLRLIGYVLGDMPRAVAGYERVAEVLAEPLPAAPAGGRELPDGPLELEVDRLGYGYEPGGRGAARGVVPGPGREHRRPGRPHRVRQVDPGPAAGPPAHPRPGRHPARRPRPGHAGRRRAGRVGVDRLPGAVPVLGLGGRQHPAGATPRRCRSRRDGWPRPTSSWPACPTATTRWSASAGRPCPAASASGSPWPAPWPAGPGCWCWTTPPPASTR